MLPNTVAFFFCENEVFYNGVELVGEYYVKMVFCKIF